MLLSQQTFHIYWKRCYLNQAPSLSGTFPKLLSCHLSLPEAAINNWIEYTIGTKSFVQALAPRLRKSRVEFESSQNTFHLMDCSKNSSLWTSILVRTHEFKLISLLCTGQKKCFSLQGTISGGNCDALGSSIFMGGSFYQPWTPQCTFLRWLANILSFTIWNKTQTTFTHSYQTFATDWNRTKTLSPGTDIKIPGNIFDFTGYWA